MKMTNTETRMTKKARRGFTFVELCIGLAITTMVFSALAAFSMAMATAWRSAETTQAVTMKINFVNAQVQNEIRNARLIGACRVGSSDSSAAGAAVLIWKTDTNQDGFIQGNECELILHDTTNHNLLLYPTGTSDGAGTWSYSGTFNAATSLDQFILNRPSKVLAHGVYGAIFQSTGTNSATNSPALKYALKMMVDDARPNGGHGGVIGGGGQVTVEYGGATVRAPIAAPSN
jgi:Tfp pilus assembly major pilin PilA